MSEAIEPIERSSAITTGNVYTDGAAFALAQRWGTILSQSQLVPEALRGKPADCIVAFGLARAMNLEPLHVLQNIYFIKGKPGWNAQFLIARCNASGRFAKPLRWRVEGAGPSLSVTCYTQDHDGDVIEETVTMAMAVSEGWVSNNSKYKSIPALMLKYRSASFLIGLNCPEVKFGLSTVEELEDAAASVPKLAASQADRIKGRLGIAAVVDEVPSDTTPTLESIAEEVRQGAPEEFARERLKAAGIDDQEAAGHLARWFPGEGG